MHPRYLAFALALTTGCVATVDDLGAEDLDTLGSSLTAAQRRARAGEIRDAAAANGITEGWLLAGIADAETRMSHCHSELTWACRGPASPDCGGGPVVAGAGDGPCSLQQGGLGMFQFDAGTFDQTLAREGRRVLSIAGNVAAAVDFVVAMVIRSAYVSGVSDEAQAIAWINGVRVGNGRWDAWVRTVTHYYNGCRPGAGCFPERYARYRDHAADVFAEMGADFWSTPSSPSEPVPAGACVHSFGGVYGDGACSGSWQCCDGSWGAEGSCGACACRETTGETGCTPAPEPPAPPSGSGASCSHSFGGTYASGACSASWQCCDGAWGAHGTCGSCTCVEGSGTEGCDGAPAAPPPGASCGHSFGGTYANTACSASWQCCDGAWRSRGACGGCFCVEGSGETGCGT